MEEAQKALRYDHWTIRMIEMWLTINVADVVTVDVAVVVDKL